MPTYDYECRSCGHAFELFQQMTAPVKRKCPECGKLKLERLIGTGAGVLFKGDGFYETDYRSESYKKAAEAEKKSAESSSEKSGEKKGDAAPCGSGCGCAAAAGTSNGSTSSNETSTNRTATGKHSAGKQTKSKASE